MLWTRLSSLWSRAAGRASVVAALVAAALVATLLVSTAPAQSAVALNALEDRLWSVTKDDDDNLNVNFSLPALNEWYCAQGTPTSPPFGPHSSNPGDRTCYNVGNSTQAQLDATNIDEGPLESLQSRYRIRNTGSPNTWTNGRNYDFYADYPLGMSYRPNCATTGTPRVTSCTSLTSGTVYEVQIRLNSQVIGSLTSAGTGAWSSTKTVSF